MTQVFSKKSIAFNVCSNILKARVFYLSFCTLL